MAKSESILSLANVYGIGIPEARKLYEELKQEQDEADKDYEEFLMEQYDVSDKKELEKAIENEEWNSELQKRYAKLKEPINDPISDDMLYYLQSIPERYRFPKPKKHIIKKLIETETFQRLFVKMYEISQYTSVKIVLRIMNLPIKLIKKIVEFAQNVGPEKIASWLGIVLLLLFIYTTIGGEIRIASAEKEYKKGKRI